MQSLQDQVSALALFKSAASSKPDYALAHYNAANIYLRQRLWEESIKLFDKAAELDPKNKSVVMNRGLAKFLLNGNM